MFAWLYFKCPNISGKGLLHRSNICKKVGKGCKNVTIKKLQQMKFLKLLDITITVAKAIKIIF